jgi:hypothetical protein
MASSVVVVAILVHVLRHGRPTKPPPMSLVAHATGAQNYGPCLRLSDGGFPPKQFRITRSHASEMPWWQVVGSQRHISAISVTNENVKVNRNPNLQCNGGLFPHLGNLEEG